ncbi:MULTISPECIES: Fic family protein [unclassified Treponema]|uniref:Fic family protein n=1 Tax=unclassified Treponema TaxID=2638727 RepID=UPI0020A46063|nr:MULTISPECIES: Fic family protein [unclassified Treponema]
MNKIRYISVKETAKHWKISERSVRNYCLQGRIIGALLEGKTWKIPSDAKKPRRKTRHTAKQDTLLSFLKREKETGLKGGIYHKIQIDLTYNSNHIEGSKLTHDQTRFIFETKTLGITDEVVRVDDIIETVNHFHCIDLIIEGAHTKLSESFIKQLHYILKYGTTDNRKSWFKVGDYKMPENEAGGDETTKPSDVASEMKVLLMEYNSKSAITFDDILDFHVRFEAIHPFQDGNGRIGRLIMFKECLKHNIVPFIITEELKIYYYRGIKNWKNERGYLRDTCLTGQDLMKQCLDYFGIMYN